MKTPATRHWRQRTGRCPLGGGWTEHGPNEDGRGLPSVCLSMAGSVVCRPDIDGERHRLESRRWTSVRDANRQAEVTPRVAERVDDGIHRLTGGEVEGDRALGATTRGMMDLCLGGVDAGRVPVEAGSAETLATWLESVSEPHCDSKLDGFPDGWRLAVYFDLVEATFPEGLAAYTDLPTAPRCQ